MEQERRKTEPRINELEKKVQELTQRLAAAESSLVIKDSELSTMHINLKELEDLREMKEVIFILVTYLNYNIVIKYKCFFFH